jgi:ribonuclease P protein component
MNRRFRLTSSEDFNQVKRDGKTVSNKLFRIILCPNQTSNIRFGFITGKSIGNAVTRNRCKRLMRASIQQISTSLQPGWDVVIIVRQAAAQADFQTTQTALMEIFKRSGLLVTANDEQSR